jgi:hypothetical protein
LVGSLGIDPEADTFSLFFDRYNIVNEADLKAAKSLSEYFEREKRATMGTIAGTLTDQVQPVTEQKMGEVIGKIQEDLELARGIEPPTCGLQTWTRRS